MSNDQSRIRWGSIGGARRRSQPNRHGPWRAIPAQSHRKRKGFPMPSRHVAVLAARRIPNPNRHFEPRSACCTPAKPQDRTVERCRRADGGVATFVFTCFAHCTASLMLSAPAAGSVTVCDSWRMRLFSRDAVTSASQSDAVTLASAYRIPLCRAGCKAQPSSDFSICRNRIAGQLGCLPDLKVEGGAGLSAPSGNSELICLVEPDGAIGR